MVDVEMLDAKIKDSGMTIVAICDKSEITRQTFYKRRKKLDFKIDEVQRLKKVLNLTTRDVQKIFFAKNSNLK